MQPVFTQVPPNALRSMIATFMPALANRAARGGPACPVPMMIASNCCCMALLRFDAPGRPWRGALGRRDIEPHRLMQDNTFERIELALPGGTLDRLPRIGVARFPPHANAGGAEIDVLG